MTRIHARNGGVAAPSALAPKAKAKVASGKPAGRDLAAERHRDHFEPAPSRVRHGRHRHGHGAIAHASGDTSPIPPEKPVLLSDTSPIPPEMIASTATTTCAQPAPATTQVQTASRFGVRTYGVR